MPYLMMQTNQELSDSDRDHLVARLSEVTAKALGKAESYVMVAIEDGVAMSFAGTREPLAYVELKTIGLPENATGELSQTLCAAIETETEIRGDRIYIEFKNTERHLWGWNHSTL